MKDLWDEWNRFDEGLMLLRSWKRWLVGNGRWSYYIVSATLVSISFKCSTLSYEKAKTDYVSHVSIGFILSICINKSHCLVCDKICGMDAIKDLQVILNSGVFQDESLLTMVNIDLVKEEILDWQYFFLMLHQKNHNRYKMFQHIK